MKELKEGDFSAERPAFFVTLQDGLHRAENIFTLKDAAKMGVISLVEEHQRTIIIGRTDVMNQDTLQTVELLETHHTGQVKFSEETLKPNKPACINCGEHIKAVKIIADTSADAICCASCDSMNPASLVTSKPKTVASGVITDLESFRVDYKGPAAEVLSTLKGVKNKVEDMLNRPDSELEKAIKPFGDAEITVWEFAHDENTIPVSRVSVQIGELRTSALISEDLSAVTEAESDDEGTINLPQVIGELSISTVKEGDDYDVLLVKGQNNAMLPLYILYDEDGDPSECIVSSRAIAKGGWSIKATNDVSDSDESYFELKTLLKDSGLLTDDGDWEVDTDEPFGYVKVEYPEDKGEGIPSWAVQMEEAGIIPEAGVLYVNIDIPGYDMGNLKISYKNTPIKSKK